MLPKIGFLKFIKLDKMVNQNFFFFLDNFAFKYNGGKVFVLSLYFVS